MMITLYYYKALSNVIDSDFNIREQRRTQATRQTADGSHVAQKTGYDAETAVSSLTADRTKTFFFFQKEWDPSH